MNYFKYSPLKELAKSRLRKYEGRNPMEIKKRSNKQLENLDILEVYAQRKTLAERKATGNMWRGGDK